MGPDEDSVSRDQVSQDHLLLMHLLYVRRPEKNADSAARGAVIREGYASLESLREVSGLPAWRVWELTEELQELGLVSCVWNSRALRSQSSAESPVETSGDSRFLRGTQVALTDRGHSYPPLLEYHSQRQQKSWEKPRPVRERSERSQERSQERSSGIHQSRQPRQSAGRWPARRLEPLNQPSRAYHIYRPREQAARRLKYLACTFFLLILIAAIYLVLALT